MKTKRKRKLAQAAVSSTVRKELGQVMHFALLTIQGGYPHYTDWERVAEVLHAISTASKDNDRVKYTDKITIDASLITLKQIADWEVKTGKWSVKECDLVVISRGILAAETSLAVLDSRKISACLS